MSGRTGALSQIAVRIGARLLRDLELEFTVDFVTPIGTHCATGHRVAVRDLACFSGEPAVCLEHEQPPVLVLERGGLWMAEWVLVAQLIGVVRTVPETGDAGTVKEGPATVVARSRSRG